MSSLFPGAVDSFTEKQDDQDDVAASHVNDMQNSIVAIQTALLTGRWGGKGTDIASASPLVIGTDGIYSDVTGTSNFSAMTVAAGRLFFLQFDGVLTITHGADIDIPGGGNLTTEAGDVIICFSTAANTVAILGLIKGAIAPSHGSLHWFHSSSTVAAGSTVYMQLQGYAGGESGSQFPMPRSYRVSRIYAIASVNAGASETFTYTVRKNGVATAVTCQTTGATNIAQDTTNKVVFANGDLFSIELVTSAGAGVASHRIGVEIELVA